LDNSLIVDRMEICADVVRTSRPALDFGQERSLTLQLVVKEFTLNRCPFQ